MIESLDFFWFRVHTSFISWENRKGNSKSKRKIYTFTPTSLMTLPQRTILNIFVNFSCLNSPHFTPPPVIVPSACSVSEYLTMSHHCRFTGTRDRFRTTGLKSEKSPRRSVSEPLSSRRTVAWFRLNFDTHSSSPVSGERRGRYVPANV